MYVLWDDLLCFVWYSSPPPPPGLVKQGHCPFQKCPSCVGAFTSLLAVAGAEFCGVYVITDQVHHQLVVEAIVFKALCPDVGALNKGQKVRCSYRNWRSIRS